jgi:exonuclease SbcC
MIKSLVLKNFQSHRDTTVEFHKGFNAIVGSTDNGKSGLYRALYFTRFNKASTPISFWNQKKDESPKEETSVTVSTDSDVVQRVRSPDMNGYKLNNDTLAAIGRGADSIPDGVLSALNLSEINFFSQHDSPFLLKESAGKVAEKLNELVHLDDIDRILSSLDSLKRETGKGLKSAVGQIEETAKSIEALSWVDSAQDVIEYTKGIQGELEDTQEEHRELSQYLDGIQTKSKVLLGLEDIVQGSRSVLEEIDQIEKEKGGLVDESRALERILSGIQSVEASIEKLKGIDATEELEYCDTILKELDDTAEDLAELVDWIQKYTTKEDRVKNLEEELGELEKEMPEVCPECGRPLVECED